MAMPVAQGRNRDRIEELADRLESDLGALESFWRAVPNDQRAIVIGRIGSSAPGVARLLCPHFGRFASNA